MDKKETQIIEEIVEIGSLLYQQGLIVSYDGNISARYGNTIWITPTRICKGRLTTLDLVQVDLNGRILQSLKNHKPTSELIMHLEIYKHRKDVNAIVHAHPPYAVAVTLTGLSLMNTDLPEISLILGDVPTAEYALTGTKEMFDAIKPYLDYNAILLSHHGALTMGRDLFDAYYKMEQLEHCAKILCIAKQIGNIIPLPEDRKREIHELKKKNLY
ncbi:MAG: aldolase [Leptospiraceae bacterium]|nr:MAG: aldolase [Leptospiraceae bacterium]